MVEALQSSAFRREEVQVGSKGQLSLRCGNIKRCWADQRVLIARKDKALLRDGDFEGDGIIGMSYSYLR